MKINQATTVREIDDIVPLIDRLYEKSVIGRYISRSGYIAWLTMNIANPDFAIWYVTEGTEVKGFCILQKTLRLFEFECHVHDAFMGWYDTEFSEKFMESIESWAEDKQCTTISCLTSRPDGMSKRFGFEKAGSLMMKAI
jgi:hypothetical protein